MCPGKLMRIMVVMGGWALLASCEQPPVSDQAVGKGKAKGPATTLARRIPVPPGMIRVDAGAFWRGCNDEVDVECDEDESPGRQVKLNAFFIDRTEVSVAGYQACVKAEICLAPRRTKGCNFVEADHSQHPVNCVTWDQAFQFCAWSGKRLPTEAEWEKAARGTAGKKYPWGDDWPSCEKAVMLDGGSGCGRNGTWPVCSKPAGNSPYGLCDMAGNVVEWVSDWYLSSSYVVYNLPNPTGPKRGKRHVIRGGSFESDTWMVRSSMRASRKPSQGTPEIGFRCAKSLLK